MKQDFISTSEAGILSKNPQFPLFWHGQLSRKAESYIGNVKGHFKQGGYFNHVPVCRLKMKKILHFIL